MQVILDELTNATGEQATPPTVTVVDEVKFVPSMLSVPPPSAEPRGGEIVVIDRTGPALEFNTEAVNEDKNLREHPEFKRLVESPHISITLKFKILLRSLSVKFVVRRIIMSSLIF